MQDFNEKLFQNHILASPDRILVATDLTDADFLVQHAIAQAKVSGAHVSLIHAIVSPDSLPITPTTIPYIDESKIDGDVRRALCCMARRIESHGISCDSRARHGSAADVIREEINSTGATRLVVGTHGRGKFARIALGSVVNELLRTVEIPVFAVGPHSDGFGEHILPRRILHPVSLVGDYQKSVCFAIDLAQTFRAELILMHVLDPDTGMGINPGRALDWAKNALAALIPNAEDLVPPVVTISKFGNLVEEILSTETSTRANWIVLGVDRGFPLLRFKDTTAYKVLAEATCPVLTLRHEPHPVERTIETETRFAGVIG